MLNILLVEDRPAEREILATAFEHRGARVKAVGTDSEAYDALRELKSELAAIVTDVNLGLGTTGFDVARAARAVRSDLAVVYITAHEMETSAHEVADCLMLRKPMRLTEVADVVLGYLAERDRSGPAHTQRAGE